MRLLAEQPGFLEFFAILACAAGVFVEFDTDKQPASANFLDFRVVDFPEPFHEIRAHFFGVLDELVFGQDFEGGAGHGAGERVAAEGGAVFTRLEHAEDLGVGEDGGDGVKAARQGLAYEREVGFDVFVFFGKQLAGASETGLDFVEDEDDFIFIADAADVFEVAVWRDDDTCFTLDRFDEKGHGVVGDGGFECVGVTEVDDLESGRERAEAGSGCRVGGKEMMVMVRP